MFMQVNGDNRGRVLSVVLQAVPYSKVDHNQRLIESMMGLRPRQRKSQARFPIIQVSSSAEKFSDFSSLIRGSSEDETWII